ncbi:MAG: hypothetical protein J7574_12035 [Flavobacterium sp.]|uniref:OB-fold protein n=1 Tax=Flavobacterium sp. TaxID=239 RepID=UPI001B0EB2E9|nr:hypothetical protein [Flavobacterium sp.]MBO9584879.1 hypothetical protein [Flavobacterium sp.]
MNKRSRLIILIVFVIGLAVVFLYAYVMYGGSRNLETEKTNFTVTSASITAEFSSDIEASNKKYLEQAVAINGKITAVNGKEIIMDDHIICSFKNQDISIKKGKTVTIKGRIIGYDDLMEELKLDQCFAIKN